MRTLLAVLLILVGTQLFCQIRTETAIIDFKSKSITTPNFKKLKIADYIQIRIDNIPMSKYKITINRKDSVIATNQPPALFSALSFGDGYTKLLANLSDYGVRIIGNILKKDSASALPSQDLTSALNQMTLMKGMPEDFVFSARKSSSSPAIPEMTFYLAIKALKLIGESPKTNGQKEVATHALVFKNDETFKFFLKNATKLLAVSDWYNNNPGIINELTDIAQNAPKLNDSLQTLLKIDGILSTMNLMRQGLYSRYFEFRDNVIIPADNLLLDYRLKNVTTCLGFKNTADGIMNYKRTYIAGIENDYKQYFDNILPEYELIAKTIALSKSDSMIQKYRKDFYIIIDKIDSVFNTKLIGDVCEVIKAPAPVTNFVSLPYSIKGDISEFDIKVDPLDSKDQQSYNTIIFMPRRTNVLWNFSSGIYISGISKKAERWSFKVNLNEKPGPPPTYDTLNYTLVKESTSSVETGISALLHAGGYFGQSNFGYHMSFGAGLSLESKPKPRILIGPGVTYGRKNQVMVTVGWLGGFVKQLSGAYDPTKNYPGPATDITDDRFKGSLFVSLTYAIL
jgi:hypothetical protein